MPIYEYTCLDCKAEFELIRSFKDADSNLSCVVCHGDHIQRKLSLFNASSEGVHQQAIKHAAPVQVAHANPAEDIND